MKRKIYFLMLSLIVSVASFAQQLSVQGVPRQQARTSVQAEPAVVYPNVDFGQIEYWVGDGNNKAALVVKWDDGKGGNTNLVWGYMWDDEKDGTGAAMLRAVAAADPRFYMLVYGNTQYGAAIGGFGYDLNENGNIALMKGGVSYSLTDGVYNTSTYDFDDWTSNDANDHWRSGWYNGYWSYWVTDDVNTAYEYSGLGASSRKLSDGSIDGWSYMSDMTTWYSNDMSGEVEYVTEPAAALAANAVKTNAYYADGNATATTYTVRSATLEAFTEALDKAVDGDIIEFYGGLRGQVLEIPSGGYEITKSVTINGNGIVFSGYRLGDGSDAISVTLKNIIFKDIDDMAIFFNKAGSNLTVENCVFDNCVTTSSGSAISFSMLSGLSATVMSSLTVKGCRFSNNKCTGSSSVSYGTVSANTTNSKSDYLSVQVVSSTFVGNEAPTGSAIDIKNNAHFTFANCVFEDNVATSDGGTTINSNRDDDTTAERIRSLGYNVIGGTMSGTLAERLADADIIGEELDGIVSLQNGEYQVAANAPAYYHLPANTVIDGIAWPATDITGAAIDYTKATHSGACQLVYSTADVDYTKGTFIVNEDWYGHQNSTVNFLTDDGEWYYRVVQKENPGVELGCTNQYGAIYGDKFYFIAKQAKDPGANVTGGRITVCDAKTMKVIKQIENISTDENGTSNADGRGFLGVDEHKGYIGTSNGIFIFDLDNLEVTGRVSGSENGADSDYGHLYSGQIGNMVRVNDRVFAVHQKNGLLVINPETDEVEQTIEAPDTWGFGSVVLSKDGNLWLSLASPSGSGQADTRIMKVDPATLETTIITLPEGIFGPANSWYAWTPDCFCASTQTNTLYWNGGNSSWFSGYTIYKYDIDNNEFSTFLDFHDDPDGWQIYGCSFRVDPVTDDAFVSLYKGFGDPTYVLRRYDSESNMLGEYPMISNYWFPSLPVFPDNEAPVVSQLPQVEAEEGTEQNVPLDGIATDADNMESAIVKTVTAVSDESVLTAEMLHGDLVITPLKAGTADITLKINSNGKLAETTVSVTVNEATGISSIETEGATVVGYYSLDGKKLDAPQRGINILRMSDGTTRKVMIR